MGLDCVELVISIEQAFGIQISDEVAVGLETPGKVIDYIQGLQASGPTPGCLSQRAFHRLRSGFLEESLCARDEFHPDTDLESIVPRHRRKRVWTRLKARTDLNFPDLERSSALWKGLLILTLLTSISLAAYLSESFGECLGLLLVFSISLGILAILLSTPFAVYLPTEAATPAQLVEYLVAHDPNRFIRNHEVLSRAQIAATVKALTISFCNERDYREDAHFVKDLGLD